MFGLTRLDVCSGSSEPSLPVSAINHVCWPIFILLSDKLSLGREGCHQVRFDCFLASGHFDFANSLDIDQQKFVLKN